MMIRDIIKIIKTSTFHERIIKINLYMEKSARIKFPFKVLRKIINQCTYHCEIHPDSFRTLNAIVTLSLPHPYFIVIHKECSLGEHVRIYQGVTIGSTEKTGELHKLAYVGDNVMLSVKCTLLGGIKIGDNAKIGAHALILNDVAPNTTVVGLWK